MTAAQPPIEAVAASEGAAGTAAVEAPLFLAPPPTDKARARATLITDVRPPADDDKPSSPPALRFSTGN